MIDVFVGALTAGLCIGWLANAIWQHAHEPSGVEGALPTCPPRPSAPDTPQFVVYCDDRWQPEDLHALQVLLANTLPLDVAQARYDAVLDQIVRDEAADGVDDVEDAANRREAS